MERYFDRLSSLCDQPVGFNEHWELYHLQMSAALGMWTITLRHSEYPPNMQEDEMSRAMVQRMTTVMNDLGPLDV